MSTSSVQSAGDLAVMQSSAQPILSGKITGTKSMATIDKASKDFEGMFMSQMMQPMFESVDVDPVFGGGHGEQVMRTFLVQEYGKLAAKSGGLGIAAEVKSEMIRAQAAASGHGG